MVLNLTIPEPGKSGRIKDLIINILSFDWPLTLSQIHYKITKEYHRSVSYQATYKSLTELISENVISKQDRLYQINIHWVEKLKEFSVHIESNYKNNEKVPLLEGVLKVKTENNVTVMTFNSLLELDKMWLNIKKEYYKNRAVENEVTFWEGNHCWWLLAYPELEYGEIEILKKKKVKDFVIVHNNTPLDLLAKKFYDRAGIKFRISKSKVESDMTVFGDTIMQVYLPSQISEKIDEVYSKCKSTSDVDIHYLLKEVLTKDIQINLVLTRNREIAEQLKQKTVKDFN